MLKTLLSIKRDLLTTFATRPACLEEPLPFSSEPSVTDKSTLLFIDFSPGSPLGPVNSLLVVEVRGEFVGQIFVNGRPSKFALVSWLNGFNTLGN